MKTGKCGVLVGLVSAGLVLAFASCSPSSKSGRGLALPEGDIDRGQAAFINLNCTTCHTIKDVILPDPPGQSEIMLELGGEVLAVKTYGDLITSVINPSHIISSKYYGPLETGQTGELTSPMPDLTQEMTVAQLIDLIAFLHSRYTLKPPPAYSDYPIMP